MLSGERNVNIFSNKNKLVGSDTSLWEVIQACGK